MNYSTSLTLIEFWDIKHKTDDLAAKLGWDKQRCKAYIQERYGKDSRLVMTDDQLVDLLSNLTGLVKSQTTTLKLKPSKHKRRRRRK